MRSLAPTPLHSIAPMDSGVLADLDYLRPKTLTYTAGDLTQIDYEDGSGYKTLAYTAGDLTQVQRYDATGRLIWTKDLTYTAGDLTDIAVS